jgi:hypothetical protein
MSRVWTMALWRIGKHREKFGRAEVKRGVAKSAPGCRAFAAERSCLARCHS